ncbi:MAG: DUF4214 domain-containing protein [Clostridiales bacterium]|nr:DUF4214 domain-containing protein [Candidatus Apopatocola equi]
MNAMTRRRFLSILLCCILLLGVFPTAAFAQDAEETETALAEKAAIEEEPEAETEAVEETEEIPEVGFEQEAEEPLEAYAIGCDIIILPPMTGENFGESMHCSIPYDVPYGVRDFDWYFTDTWESVREAHHDTTFDGDKSYFAKITLVSVPGYEFSKARLGDFTINGGSIGIRSIDCTENELTLWTNFLSPNPGRPVVFYAENAICNGAKYAVAGSGYSCKIEPSFGYELSRGDIHISVDGEEVTQTKADYWSFDEVTHKLTIDSWIITGNVYIVAFPRLMTFPVDFINNGHTAFVGEPTAAYGSDYVCTLNPDPGYRLLTSSIEVYCGDERIDNYTVNEAERTVKIPAESVIANLTIAAKSLPDYDGSGMAGFVNRMYWNLLGRTPSEQDIADGVWQLSNGTTGIQYAYQFAFSNEFCAKNLCDYHFSAALFEAFIGRTPDESELSYRAYQLQQGQSREQVFNDLVSSEEFRNICTEAGITLGSPIAVSGKGTKPGGRCTESGCHSAEKNDAFSERLYTEALKRTPAPDEVDAWTFYLIHCDHTAKSAAKYFFFSDEMIGSKLSNEEFLSRLYKCLMDREGSAAEIDFWAWCLTTDNAEYSTTRKGVFDQFVDSDEFRVLCQNYGMICE